MFISYSQILVILILYSLSRQKLKMILVQF